MLLSYVSANRDEDVFADPFRFDVGRDPNKHLSFGHGVHFCPGGRVASWRSTASSPSWCRGSTIELAGEPETMATTFVGGLAHLPIRAGFFEARDRPHGCAISATRPCRFRFSR